MFRLLSAVVVSSAPWCASAAVVVDTGLKINDKVYHHKWIPKQTMGVKRSDMSATTVGDAIYLIGGCVKDQEWVADPNYPGYSCGSGTADSVTARTTRYVPATDSHEILFAAPRARYRHADAAVGTKIYLFGGSDAAGAIVTAVDVYDTAASTWSTLATAWSNATTDCAAFAYEGKIYVLGGYDAAWTALQTTMIFDPAGTGAAAWSTGAPLVVGRGDFSAEVIGTSAYILGGFTHTDEFKAPLKSMETMNLKGPAFTWSMHQAMQVARGDKATAVLNGILHVVGGESKNADGHSVPLRDVEVYFPGPNAWYFGGDIPTDRFRFTGAALGDSMFLFGGQGYLVGGYGAVGSKYPVMDTVEEYHESVADATTDVSAAVVPAAPAAAALGLAFAALLF